MIEIPSNSQSVLCRLTPFATAIATAQLSQRLQQTGQSVVQDRQRGGGRQVGGRTKRVPPVPISVVSDVSDFLPISSRDPVFAKNAKGSGKRRKLDRWDFIDFTD
jgi:hypothetical protein